MFRLSVVKNKSPAKSMRTISERRRGDTFLIFKNVKQAEFIRKLGHRKGLDGPIALFPCYFWHPFTVSEVVPAANGSFIRTNRCIGCGDHDYADTCPILKSYSFLPFKVEVGDPVNLMFMVKKGK